MRGTVWHRAIRPTIRVASSIIFVFFVINRGAGFAGNGLVNVPDNRIQSEFGRSNRHLLENVGEDEVTQHSKDETHSQEFKYEGQVLPSVSWSESTDVQKGTEGSACTDASEHPGYSDSCSYVKATPECRSGTLIEYTQVFYCVFSGTPGFAYAALILLLAALFYTLGHTAHHFFCVSMDKLSQILEMSSTLAGVTLLPFGNGAPDVFASIAAFGHSGQGQVGLNSVLGGAMFVSSVVAGSVTLAIIAAQSDIELDRADFLRDVGFFLFTLATLIGILYDEKIHFWEAVLYVAIYAAYVITVTTVECIKRRRVIYSIESRRELLDPDQRKLASHEDMEISRESAQNVDITNDPTNISSVIATSLPGRGASNVDIDRQPSLIPFLQVRNEQEVEELQCCSLRGFFSYFIAWPLTLPRRLTIPLIEDPPRWSKFYGVCSVTFAPILLAMVWDGKDGGPLGSARAVYIVAGSVGIVLGGLSLIFLKEDRPPQRWWSALWAAGGFIMSMVWFYVIAVELVAVLVALGAIWKIDPAIFGLTVLAWGNSLGDMMSNLALVSHGDHRMQTSFSGCYAGPMFNTLIGIGMSFVLASWKTYPAPFPIPEDSSLVITLACLVSGLVWALVMLLSRDMKPTKTFGVGLLILYTLFLALRLACALDIKSILLNGGIR